MQSKLGLGQIATVTIILTVLIIGLATGFELSTRLSPTSTYPISTLNNPTTSGTIDSKTSTSQSRTQTGEISFPDWTNPRCTTYTSGTQCFSYMNYTSAGNVNVFIKVAGGEVNLTALVLVSLQKNVTTTQQNTTTHYLLTEQLWGYNDLVLSNQSLGVQVVPYTAPLSSNITISYNTAYQNSPLFWQGTVYFTTKNLQPEILSYTTTEVTSAALLSGSCQQSQQSGCPTLGFEIYNNQSRPLTITSVKLDSQNGNHVGNCTCSTQLNNGNTSFSYLFEGANAPILSSAEVIIQLSDGNTISLDLSPQ